MKASPRREQFRKLKSERVQSVKKSVKSNSELVNGANLNEEDKVFCKSRKRKEPRENINLLHQGRKITRSASEERPLGNMNNVKDIRRVSSHEDFEKSRRPSNNESAVNQQKVHFKHSPHSQNQTQDTLSYEDSIYERRRSHERLAMPVLQRTKCHNFEKRRNRSSQRSASRQEEKERKREKEQSNIPIEQEQKKEKTYEESSPNLCAFVQELDLSSLHEQIDCSEPVPSSSSREITEDTETLPSSSVASSRLLLSPRNSIIITHRIYLDSNIPKVNVAFANNNLNDGIEEKRKQILKKINSLKKKIKTFEKDFYMKHGFKPSHADKMNDKSMKKIYSDLSVLKKEYNTITRNSDASVAATPSLKTSTDEPNKSKTLQETLIEIEKRLTEKRAADNRSSEIEEMSEEEIMAEKTCMQKALLYLESLHGRPTVKSERNLIRPLYDRYRTLKRMVAKFSTINNNINELATIHEHEAMDFISQPVSLLENETDKRILSTSTDSSETDISLDENLHVLKLPELLEQQKLASEEKKRLRKLIKDFENEFALNVGRKIQKEDKQPMADTYLTYKQVKAKLRLLKALITKRTQCNHDGLK